MLTRHGWWYWVGVVLMLGLGVGARADYTPASDFTDNGDGTVYHRLTGLTWKRCAEGQTWTGSTCSGTGSTYTWDQAQVLTSGFAGRSDWRLPMPWELTTILDLDIASPGPVINGVVFPNTSGAYFWAGSLNANDSTSAWYVSFYVGEAHQVSRNSGYPVRLVRGGQFFGNLVTPTSDFTDNGDGTVTHKRTKLTWKRCSEGQSWSGTACTGVASIFAVDQATTLTGTFAGKSDWRTPNYPELFSIFEVGTDSPAINSAIFPNTPNSFFLSSSPYASNPGQIWGVRFGVSNNYVIRLVRGVQSFDPLPIATFALSVTPSGTGSGQITSSSASIACSSSAGTASGTCSSNESANTSLTLSATSAAGSTFTGWGGACSGTAPACTLTINSAKAVSASFQAAAVAVTTLTVTAPASLQSAGRTALAATARYADNSTKPVTPTWTSSNPAVATVSTTGVLSAASVSANTAVTITATYVENGVSVSASQTLTITAAAAGLSNLSVSGNSSVQSGGQILLTVNASYADGSSRQVMPSSWSVVDASKGSVNSRGVLAVSSVSQDTPIVVTAGYTEGGVSKTASLSITITTAASNLSQLTIIGARGSLAPGETLSLAAEGQYADGSRKRVIPTWSVSNPALASISAAGLLSPASIITDSTITVTARYTEGSVTSSATFAVSLQAAAVVSAPISAEVEATGGLDHYSLGVWINTADVVGADQFALSSGTVPFASDANATCTQQFGSSYRLADWGDLSAYFVSGGKLNQLVSSSGFEVKQNAWVTLNGVRNHTTDRKYFAGYHNHNVPVGNVVLDHLDNHFFDLGSWTDALYALCYRPSSASTPRTASPRASTRPSYNLYVVAFVPNAGGITAFTLNRSKQWQGLSSPLAEYLAGVQVNEWNLVKIFDDVDLSGGLLRGAMFYVGFGTSDTEMLSAGRYRQVYLLP